MPRRRPAVEGIANARICSHSLRAPRFFLVWRTVYYSLAAGLEAVGWVWEDEVRRWAPWLRRR